MSKRDASLLLSTLPIGLAVVVITMAAFFRVPLLPDIGSDLDMSVADLGVLTTVFALGRLVTDIPAGRLADRIQPGSMMAGSAMLVAVASFILALAPVSLVAYLAAFLLGLGSALTNTTGMTYFSSAAPSHRRGASVSIFAAGLLVGQAIGPTLGGLLGSAGGWRRAEAAAGVIAVVAAAVLLASRRRSTPIPAGRVQVEPGPSPPGGEIVLRYRLLLYLVPFAMFASLGALTQTLIPIIGDAELGLRPGAIGLALGLGGLFRLIGSILGGQVADRLSRKTALVPGLFGQAAGVALLALGSSTAIWLTSIIIMSISSLGIAVAATMLADLSFGSGVGRRLGPFRFAGDLGLVLSPIAVAGVFESFGTAPAVLPVAAMLALTGIAVAVFLPETRWLEEAEAQR